MKKISIFDTSVTSYNVGNEIIMESIYGIVEELFPEDFVFFLPWEAKISKVARNYLENSNFVFFGGTNALTSYIRKYSQLPFRWSDLVYFNKLILLGVGWWQYQHAPDLYTRFYLKRLLEDNIIHSVRDNYTRLKLADIGINNVLNTCCPTTWNLTKAHCAKIPSQKSDNVVFTLTDYNKSFHADAVFINLLTSHYNSLYFWIQGEGDMEYIRSFGEMGRRIKVIPPKLRNYDNLIESVPCDYIGTRLHAGIRALQKGRRALILAVDNRANEISRDIGLQISQRHDFDFIKNFIEGNFVCNLRIPFDQIALWKKQFVI